MNSNGKTMLVLATMLSLASGVILSAMIPQQQVSAQNMTAGNNITSAGNMTAGEAGNMTGTEQSGSISGVDQDEAAEATEVPPGPTPERSEDNWKSCAQKGKLWVGGIPHNGICIPWPKGCPDPDNPQCPSMGLPPADEQPEEGQLVQPPADQADEPSGDEPPSDEPSGEGEGSEN